MNELVAADIKQDFLDWSGGFPPESRYQITVYMNYALSDRADASDVEHMLRDWMNAESVTQD